MQVELRRKSRLDIIQTHKHMERNDKKATRVKRRPQRYEDSDNSSKESRGKKREAQGTPDRGRERENPGATPADKARKQVHDNQVTENELEEKPEEYEKIDLQTEEADCTQEVLDEERKTLVSMITSSKLVKGKEICGVCDRESVECRCQKLPREEQGEEVDQSEQGKEQENESEDVSGGKDIEKVEKDEVEKDEVEKGGKKEAEKGRVDEIEDVTKERKDTESEKINEDGEADLAKEMEADGGTEREKKLEKGQCCACRKGGKCVRKCTCRTTDRKCLKSCTARQCTNREGDSKEEKVPKEPNQQGVSNPGPTQEFMARWTNATVLDLAKEVARAFNQVGLLTKQLDDTKKVLVEKAREVTSAMQKIVSLETQNKELRTRLTGLQESMGRVAQEVSTARTEMTAKTEKLEERCMAFGRQMEEEVRKLTHKVKNREDERGLSAAANEELRTRIAQEAKRAQDNTDALAKTVEERITQLRQTLPRLKEMQESEEGKLKSQEAMDMSPVRRVDKGELLNKQWGVGMAPEKKPAEGRPEEQGKGYLRDYRASNPYPSHPYPGRPRKGSAPTLTDAQREGMPRMGVKDFIHPERKQRVENAKKPSVEDYPSIVIRGFRKEPGRDEFYAVMAQLDLGEIKERRMQVKTIPRGFMLKVLLESREDMVLILRNKHMLRSCPIFIEEDRYPYYWRRVLNEVREQSVDQAIKSGAEGREGKSEMKDKKDSVKDSSREWIRNAPRTALFEHIFRDLEEEDNRRKNQLGNGRLGNDPRRGGSARGRWPHRMWHREMSNRGRTRTSTPWRMV